MNEPRTVEVDGARFRVDFRGFGRPLEVRGQGGGDVALAPWRLGGHLDALGRCVHRAGDGDGRLALDRRAFAGEVLAGSGVPEERRAELEPLALWWAAGGGAPGATPDADGWLATGGARVRLRPWSHRERAEALARCTRRDGAGGATLDFVSYLRAMLAASVAAVEPEGLDVEELDAESGLAVLDAVVSLNAVDEPPPDPELAATTLRLCRALGWTPGRVWDTPAVEVSRLLALLDVVEGPAPPASSVSGAPRGLAAHPDATVIRIVDDEP